jgi:hypothetical protein
MRLFMLLFCALFSALVFGQNVKPDKIFKKDNTQIEARVIEITESQVKYRKFSNLEGPIYTINKNELTIVIYSNGESEQFGPQNDTVSKPVLMNPQTSEATIKNNNAEQKQNNEKGFLRYFEGGYCNFADYTNGLGGLYIGYGLGYKFNRALSMEALVGYGTYWPDNPSGKIGITKLYSVYALPKLTCRIHFSKYSNSGIFFSGGAGYVGSSGEFQDYTQKGTPTYKLDGYGGFGYEIGGGLKFGTFGLSADYLASENFRVLKLGIKIGI